MKEEAVFSVPNRSGMIIGAMNLLDGEKLKVQFSLNHTGNIHTWADYFPDGKDIYLSAKCNPIKIMDEGIYRIVPDGVVNEEWNVIYKPLFIGTHNGYNH